MAVVDWLVVALYIVGALAIGALFTRKASKSAADFFVAGRSLPWIIAGTSIVATTFSSDTPLLVSGLSRSVGIHGNWFWWCNAIGEVAAVFFFAKLWRRTGVVTDIEFIVSRYEPSKARSFLRMFKVFYGGVLFNCVVVASVTLAMAKILSTLLGLGNEPLFEIPVFGGVTSAGLLLLVLGLCALAYTSLSGLYGVVYTDLIQFCLAMVGSLALAVIAYLDASSGEGMMSRLSVSSGFNRALLNMVPDLTGGGIVTISFLIYLFVAWWAAAPGRGYTVQRLLSCRSERDSMLAFLWYNFCNYVLRPWPWIVVGVLSLIYFPDLRDPDKCYPAMIDRFLPPGLKGVMVASILAAFMSTLDTQLNWGASYLVNDFYAPFVARDRSPRHYVWVSRAAMLFLTLLALVVSTRLTGIIDAYKYIGVIGAGAGTVMIARWYWWRVGTVSEISAMVASLIVGNAVIFLVPDARDAYEHVIVSFFPVRLFFNASFTLVVWVCVTFLVYRAPTSRTLEFYRRMRIPGPGWRVVAERLSLRPPEGELYVAVICWLSCCIALFATLFGVGMLIFHKWSHGVALLLLALVATFVLFRFMRSVSFFDNTVAVEKER